METKRSLKISRRIPESLEKLIYLRKIEFNKMSHIYKGAQGDYYVVDGVKYDSHFPQEWAKDHKDFPQAYPYEDYLSMTGPEKCENCAYYGSLRGVFVGYCNNCAKEYNLTRGKGFNYDDSQEDVWENLDYMKGVMLSQVGDETIRHKTPKKIKKERRKRALRRAKRIPKNKIIEDKIVCMLVAFLILACIYFCLKL